eukprot:jgi/Chrzof1/3273/Cz12g19040.t1
MLLPAKGHRPSYFAYQIADKIINLQGTTHRSNILSAEHSRQVHHQVCILQQGGQDIAMPQLFRRSRSKPGARDDVIL